MVNDRDFTVWNQWGATSWPTIALIDPAGRVVGVRAAEGVYDALEPVIAGLVAEFDASDVRVAARCQPQLAVGRSLCRRNPVHRQCRDTSDLDRRSRDAHGGPIDRLRG